MPSRRLLLTVAAALGFTSLASGNSLSAQELWGRGVRPGQISFTTGGLFESANDGLGSGGGFAGLADPWSVSDATALFPGSDVLAESLSAAGGIPGWTGFAGSVRATAQVSRVTFPVELRVGVLDRLTVGARLVSRKDWVEGAVRMPADSTIDLGVNPLVGRAGDVSTFLDAVDAAVAGLPTDGTGWSDFAARLRAAYTGSTLFPVVGSEMAEAIVSRLGDLDAASGGGSLAATAPFADVPLDTDELERALTSGDGLYRYQPLGTRLLDWNPGDIEVWADWQLLRTGGLSTVEGTGIAVRAGARLPWGTPENPNLHFDAGSGDGQLDLLASVDGWMRRARWGVSGGIDFGTTLSATERGLRLRDGSAPLSPAIWFVSADWKAGNELRLRIFPSLSPAPGLWMDTGYRLWRQADGTFDFGELGPGLPDPSITVDRSGWTRHEWTFGLRYRPPDLASGRVEVWSRWSGTIAGNGPEAPRWSTLELGGRIWRTLW